jgi:hypothetical protein
LRDVLIAHQLLAALELQLGVDLGRLGLGQCRLRLLDGRLVGRLLDPEQQVARLDVLSLFEVPLLEKALHAGDDIDFLDGGKASDVIDGFRHLPGHHRSDRNGWRRRSALGGSDATGSGDAQCEYERSASDHATRHHHSPPCQAGTAAPARLGTTSLAIRICTVSPC